MTAAEILCECRNHVAFVTLNRPGALNALSLSMITGLRSMLQRFARDSDVRAVVLGGAGDKAFCAGGDIRALHRSVRESGSMHREFFAAEYALDYSLHRYPKPYVVVMNGITMGGGMGLAQGSSLRVVGERTRMAMPEVGIGLFPDVGASFFMPRLTGALGPYLALTGLQISGADAIYAGLADVYLPPGSLAVLPDELGSIPWTDDGRADVRRLIHALAARELPAPALGVLRPAIDHHFSQESVAAILGSLEAEARPEYREWAQQTAKLMRTRSPTLLSVTLRQMQRGGTLDLAACFRMEIGMIERCFEHGDFVEGVRALLTDKDHAPRWRPGSLAEVTQASVDSFFRERWSARLHPLAHLEEIA